MLASDVPRLENVFRGLQQPYIFSTDICTPPVRRGGTGTVAAGAIRKSDELTTCELLASDSCVTPPPGTVIGGGRAQHTLCANLRSRSR